MRASLVISFLIVLPPQATDPIRSADVIDAAPIIAKKHPVENWNNAALVYRGMYFEYNFPYKSPYESKLQTVNSDRDKVKLFRWLSHECGAAFSFNSFIVELPPEKIDQDSPSSQRDRNRVEDSRAQENFVNTSASRSTVPSADGSSKSRIYLGLCIASGLIVAMLLGIVFQLWNCWKDLPKWLRILLSLSIPVLIVILIILYFMIKNYNNI